MLSIADWIERGTMTGSTLHNIVLVLLGGSWSATRRSGPARTGCARTGARTGCGDAGAGAAGSLHSRRCAAGARLRSVGVPRSADRRRSWVDSPGSRKHRYALVDRHRPALTCADGQATVTDLRSLLTPLASSRVTVAAPATPVLLPADDAKEMAAAVGAALDNVAQHAGRDARSWVLLEQERAQGRDLVLVTVRDNGPGLPPQRLAEAAAQGRLGVAQSIQGRLRDLGGEAIVTSTPGRAPRSSSGCPSSTDVAMGDQIWVLVADDHPMWRDAVARDLDEAGYLVCATAANGVEAVRRAAATSPQVVVMDLQMPGLNGVEAIRNIVAADPTVRVLVLSASGEHDDVLDAVKAGATGYLIKSASRPELLDAVGRTAADEPVFTPGLAGLVLGEYRRLAGLPTTASDADEAGADAPRLTERETEVLRLVAKGLSYKQIAERLVLSHRTVHRTTSRTR